ncbi:MAG: ornithine carbamoyltransferase [Clostridiales Family XIII bacterium]|jgi:ornithine carbamoyltransferase|nr:ornithine carbamoyltransferase [Clostridiales Family XIII bacterium]
MEKQILKGKSFLTLMDFTQDEVRYLLDLAKELKARRAAGQAGGLLAGKNILLIFEKTSSRTRCSFEIGALEEGAQVTYIGPGSSQFGKKESVRDSAQLFGKYYDAIEYRGFAQKTVEDLAKYSGVPVWNGLTDDDHPTQILADLLTIEETLAKPLSEVKVVFAGDIRNNMSYAWMYGAAIMGLHFVAYGPGELAPSESVVARAEARAAATRSGGRIEWGSDPALLDGADVIYSDIWASMGEEDQIPERVRLLTPYRVTEQMFERTGNPNAIFLHCLPSFHDFDTALAREQFALGYDIREVTDEVFQGPRSVVFEEAENRLHTIKAVMVATLSDAL